MAWVLPVSVMDLTEQLHGQHHRQEESGIAAVQADHENSSCTIQETGSSPESCVSVTMVVPVPMVPLWVPICPCSVSAVQHAPVPAFKSLRVREQSSSQSIVRRSQRTHHTQ